MEDSHDLAVWFGLVCIAIAVVDSFILLIVSKIMRNVFCNDTSLTINMEARIPFKGTFGNLVAAAIRKKASDGIVLPEGQKKRVRFNPDPLLAKCVNKVAAKEVAVQMMVQVGTSQDLRLAIKEIADKKVPAPARTAMNIMTFGIAGGYVDSQTREAATDASAWLYQQVTEHNSLLRKAVIDCVGAITVSELRKCVLFDICQVLAIGIACFGVLYFLADRVTPLQMAACGCAAVLFSILVIYGSVSWLLLGRLESAQGEAMKRFKDKHEDKIVSSAVSKLHSVVYFGVQVLLTAVNVNTMRKKHLCSYF